MGAEKSKMFWVANGTETTILAMASSNNLEVVKMEETINSKLGGGLQLSADFPSAPKAVIHFDASHDDSKKIDYERLQIEGGAVRIGRGSVVPFLGDRVTIREVSNDKIYCCNNYHVGDRCSVIVLPEFRIEMSKKIDGIIGTKDFWKSITGVNHYPAPKPLDFAVEGRSELTVDTEPPASDKSTQFELLNNYSLGALPVWSMTTLHECLYVAYDTSKIAVFNNNDTLQLKDSLPICEDLGNIWDLASCSSSNCIYISDRKKKFVHKVDKDGKCLKHWSVEDDPHGLSMNKHSQLLVTCDNDRKIRRYSSDGALLEVISLPGELIHPMHTVQLADNQYVVCVGRDDDKEHRVVVVEVDVGRAVEKAGKVVGKPFGAGRGAGVTQLNTPYRLAISNGRILVDDAKNGRVVQLKQSTNGLEFTGILVSCHTGDAYGMWLDEERCRLYLSANNGSWLFGYKTGELKVFGVPVASGM